MTQKLPAPVCPFCGVMTDVPHETQEGCIEALHAEIARMRELLSYVRVAPSEPHPDDAQN
jgi:hypothetical protein